MEGPEVQRGEQGRYESQSSGNTRQHSRASTNGKKTEQNNMEAELIELRQRIANYQAELQGLLLQNRQLRDKLASSTVTEKERAEFISNVAHELRSPLTSIKGYVDLLLEGEAGQLTELQNEFLMVVGANNDKLARIISDLLDISRLEAGRLSFNPGPNNLIEIVNKAVDTVKPQFEAKNITFKINNALNRTHLEVNADPDRLGQAIKVLLSNAARYTSEDGEASLSVNLSEDGAFSYITVNDQGPAIGTHEIVKVFTKFWQPEDPTWRKLGSPGLGLALVKAITEMHDGYVEASSNPPGNNSFTIALPLLLSAQTSLDLNEQSGSGIEHSVLVITSDASFGKMAEKLLADGGFQTILVESRSEVTSPIPAWRPELILEQSSEENEPENEEELFTSIPTLQLPLSKVELDAISHGAIAVLPWPASENSTLEYLNQIFSAESSPDETDRFKTSHGLLMVSSSNLNLRTLDKMLREGGYTKVYRATMEHDALSLTRRHHPNFLLLDASNDTNTGLGLLEALRENMLLKTMPAVVLVPPDTIFQTPAPAYLPQKVMGAKFDTKHYTNLVPKPFLRRRFLGLVRRLASGG
jgi:signal transduction histidine kinase/CheY-like chemotaxis protein